MKAVVGFVPPANGWGERVAVPTTAHLAPIPQDVSDADAAALPVAALTALYGIGRALPELTTGGRAVVYGVTASPTAELAIGPLLGSGNALVEGFNLYHESRVEPGGTGLAMLLELVRTGSLQTFVERTGSWQDVGETAADLLSRRFVGKAVLEIG